MKISNSIAKIYNDKLDLYKILERQINNKIPSLIEKTWHYDGRVKELESFAQKVETCRFNKDEMLHDLFACRIVVDNIKEIRNIRKTIEDNFIIVKVLPLSTSLTHKKPEEFPFDDLRLYCRWKEDVRSADEEAIQGLIFEIQIKTYLQHAWGISTHAMIYKGNDIDWKLNRVAFQIKAILEHVELSIGSAEELSKTSYLPQESIEFKRLKRIYKIITDYWEEESLPNDLTRLVKNIDKLVIDSAIGIGNYKVLLNNIVNENKKIKIRNLSPYYTTLQLLNDYEEDKLIKFIEKNEKLIFIEELELSSKVKDTIERQMLNKT